MLYLLWTFSHSCLYTTPLLVVVHIPMSIYIYCTTATDDQNIVHSAMLRLSLDNSQKVIVNYVVVDACFYKTMSIK